MTEGKDLMIAWNIASKTMKECEHLVDEVERCLSKSSKLLIGDWGKKGKGSKSGHNRYSAWNIKYFPRFPVLKYFVQVFKLKDLSPPDSHLWYSLYLLFESELIEKMHHQIEPLIFVAKAEVSREWQDDFKKMTSLDIVENFNVFHEEDRDEYKINFELKDFPRADGRPYKYHEKEGKEYFRANFIGYPLVSIGSSKDIEDNLIKPLFPGGFGPLHFHGTGARAASSEPRVALKRLERLHPPN